MEKIVLFLVGLVYFILGFWCLFSPDTTSGSLGLKLSNQMAYSEYMTVYGGMEVGFGIGMWVCASRRRWAQGALLFCLIFSSALALFRAASFFRYEYIDIMLNFLLIESIIAIAFLFAFIKTEKYA